MTRQMADDEVLRVLKRAIVLAEVHALVVHADELNGVKFYVAALQAERDEWSARALREQTAHHEATAALEALRGQVAGLVEAAEAVLEFPNTGPSHDWLRAELLAIKERMG